MTQKERIEQLGKEVAELKQLKRQYESKIAEITPTRVILVDSLNENDKYAITIKSGYIDVEKVVD